MIYLIPAYLFLLLFVSGAGLATVQILKRTGLSGSNHLYLPDYLIWGIISLSTLVGFISLLLPISNGVFIAILLVFLGILILFYRDSYNVLVRKAALIKRHPLQLLLFFIVLVLISISVNDPLRPSDTGAYHAQAVRWLTDFGVVPGTGNIIPRVAFNNHLFVFTSLFDAFWFKERFHLLINSFFFLLGTIIFLKALFSLPKETTPKHSLYLSVFLITPLLYLEPGVLNTLYVEMSVTILLYFLIYLIWRKPSSFTPGSLILASALTGVLITYKASMVPVALFLVPLTYISFEKGYSIFKALSVSLIPFAIVLIPFIIRNLIISGYPIYPMPLAKYFPVHFDWQMQADQVQYMVDDIKYWARTTGDHTNYKVRGATTFAWIPDWIRAVFSRFSYLFTALIISFCIVTYTFFNRIIRSQKQHGTALWILGVPLISLIWWFIQAPNIRLGYPWIFLIQGIAFAILFQALLDSTTGRKLVVHRWFQPALRAVVILGFLFILAKGSGIYTRTVGAEAHLKTQLRSMPEAEVDTLTFDQGNLTVYLSGLCYYQKPPCTPEVGGNGVQRGIQKRGDSIEEGFRVVE